MDACARPEYSNCLSTGALHLAIPIALLKCASGNFQVHSPLVVVIKKDFPTIMSIFDHHFKLTSKRCKRLSTSSFSASNNSHIKHTDTYE